ncbi:CLUMA_CG016658, isoform A [Clunio marinus]|uniref:CLUMA_CG016657, isoform A n=1 Tax=Clunio marinus TaxID=568069 RepID=A0A1J1IWB6_9DIPT|nr:CLUMA_CG016657, isoform A [Clunio marinus]CRL03441.1 CLUMA_CG016658, isoform A [Clunio marinus]
MSKKDIKYVITTELNKCIVNNKVWIFTAILCSSILRHTPVSTVKSNVCQPPWFDNDLKKLCRKKNKMHKKIDRHDPLSVKAYEDIRKQFKYRNRLAYKMYTEKISDELKENPKAFFDFVNSKNK